MQRKIIHIDMDAFYAAVEQRDDPKLRGKPVIVGGDPRSRGVVATASYEARRYGVHSAMPASQAYRLCPHGVFVRPRFEVYREASRRIQAVLHRYTALVEPLSLDEAYLDVSGSDLFRGSATRIARDIKRAILTETGLIASAGVSYNKFLAKLASDLDKPDGLTVILPERGPDFVAALPIGRFHGIGKATERRMHALGIRTGADLRGWSREALIETFGKAGAWYHRLARGEDERPVEPHRSRKSLGAETTFAQDLDDFAEMLRELESLARELAEDLVRRRLAGRTLTLKVKYADFEQVTRSQSFARPIASYAELQPHLAALLARTEAGPRPVRLLGVTVSGFDEAERAAVQLALF